MDISWLHVLCLVLAVVTVIVQGREVPQGQVFRSLRVVEEPETDGTNDTVTDSGEIHPGFRIRVTQKGIDYGQEVGIGLLMKELGQLRIPDLNEKVGPASVALSNIRMIEFPKPSSRITPIPGVGLRWQAFNINPKLEANYHARFKKWFLTINKRGSLEAWGRGMYFTMDFNIGRDSEGRPMPYEISCRAAGSVTLRFRGQWSDILNVGSSVFKSKIQSIVRAQICANAKKEINKQLQLELATFPVTQELANEFELDYRLVKFPEFRQGMLESPHRGAVYYNDDHQEPPFSPSPIPEFPEHTEKMLYMYVSDYFLNSGLFAVFLSGKMAINVTQDMIPEEGRDYMRTSCLWSVCVGTMLPQLASTFPDATLELHVLATQAPHVRMEGSHIHGKAWGDVEFYANTTTGTHFAFTLSLAVEVEVETILNGSQLLFVVHDISPEADIRETEVGYIGTGFFFETALRLAVHTAVIPRLNELGQKGIDLPTIKNVEFVDPQILEVEEENVLVVATDVRYLPHHELPDEEETDDQETK